MKFVFDARILAWSNYENLMRHKTPRISSIEKSLAILMACSSHHNHEMGTVELSQVLGFHPATVSRIVKILEKKPGVRLKY